VVIKEKVEEIKREVDESSTRGKIGKVYERGKVL